MNLLKIYEARSLNSSLWGIFSTFKHDLIFEWLVFERDLPSRFYLASLIVLLRYVSVDLYLLDSKDLVLCLDLDLDEFCISLSYAWNSVLLGDVNLSVFMVSSLSFLTNLSKLKMSFLFPFLLTDSFLTLFDLLGLSWLSWLPSVWILVRTGVCLCISNCFNNKPQSSLLYQFFSLENG